MPAPPLPRPALPARERRLREAVAAAEADRLLLDQGLPPVGDPRWEGDPFGDGVVVDEYDERQFRLWAVEDDVTAARAALEAAPPEERAAAQERLREAQRALGRARLEDDAPFTHADWRLDLATFREAGREASRRWAEDADLLHRLAARVPRSMGDTRGGTPWTSFLQELAVARSWSTRAVTLEVQQARVLAEDLPRTHGALGAGLLAVPAARALMEVAVDAPLALRGVVDALALDVVGLPAWRVKDLALKALLQADPAAAARRAARGARDRSVSIRPMTDERVEISVVGPAVAGTQAWAALDADARALRRAGDPRTLAQLRFDLFVARALATQVLPVEEPGNAQADQPADDPAHDPAPTLPDAPAAAPAWDDATVLLAGLTDPAPVPSGSGWLGDADADDGDGHGDERREVAPCACGGRPSPPGLEPPPDPTRPGWLTDRRLSRNVRVEITVPVTTARGLDDEPGWLAGYGWVSAPTVRSLLPAAELRALAVVAAGQRGAGQVVDREQVLRRPPPTYEAVTAELDRMAREPFPISGTAWQEQPQHDPSPALADLVRTRDRFDDGPVMPRVPARAADLDHDEPYRDDGRGGPTAAFNLASRGQRTHDLKHHGWSGTRTPDGTEWRSPAGQATRSPRWSAPPPPVTAERLPGPGEVLARDTALRDSALHDPGAD